MCGVWRRVQAGRVRCVTLLEMATSKLTSPAAEARLFVFCSSSSLLALSFFVRRYLLGSNSFPTATKKKTMQKCAGFCLLAFCLFASGFRFWLFFLFVFVFVFFLFFSFLPRRECRREQNRHTKSKFVLLASAKSLQRV